MAGGGSTPSNTTQTVVPWEGAQPYLMEAFQGMSEAGAPQYFPGQTLAGQSAATTGGISNLAGAAAPQGDIARSAAGGYDFTMNQMLNPETNKYLQSSVESAIAPIFKQLNTQTISGIDDAAIQAGQFGGSAQRNEKRTAIDDATKSALDLSGKMYSDAYQNSLDNYTKTLLGTGLVQGTQTVPAQTQLQAGGLQDARSQDEINAEMARYNFGQTAPFDYYTSMANTLMGMPSGSQTVTQGGNTSTTQQLLGAGALGYGAYAAGGWPLALASLAMSS